MSLSDLIAKIAALPENRLAEIERYVDTIAQTEKPAGQGELPEIVDHMNGGDFDEPLNEHEGLPKVVASWPNNRTRESKKPLKAGFMKGVFVMHDDFDEPLDFMKEYEE